VDLLSGPKTNHDDPPARLAAGRRLAQVRGEIQSNSLQESGPADLVDRARFCLLLSKKARIGAVCA
jgi:hypothetical protein